MGLRTKVRTLLDPEKRLHARLQAQRRKLNTQRPHPLTPAAIISTLDPTQLQSILSPEANPGAGIHTEKYLEMEKWLPTNIRRILNLGLDIAPPARLLDLGSGAGYFLYIAKLLGHTVAGLDVNDPTAAWYTKMFQLYQIPRTIWYILPRVPLPDLGPRFDYVTAFMACFNQPKTDNTWGVPEWQFFLDDLQTHLNPKAIVWFELNPRLDGSLYTPALETFFKSRGAIVDGKRLIWGISPLEYKVLQSLAKSETAAMRKSATPALT